MLVAFVNIAPVRDVKDRDDASWVVNAVDDTPVADSYTPQMAGTLKLLASDRSWIIRKQENLAIDSGKNYIVKAI